jgi:Tfp pilus assembly protein PilF
MARRPSIELLRGPAAVAAVLAAALAACATGRGAQAAAGTAGGAPDARAVGAAAVDPAAAGTAADPDAAVTTARGLFDVGVRLRAGGDDARAAAAFERAFAADPQLVHAGVNAGLLRERLGDLDAARALYGRVLDASPGCGPAARSLVRLALRRGDAAAAEADARARLARSPESAPLMSALADALLARGRLDEAEAVSRAALRADERSVPAMVSLATAYHRQGRSELARMVLESARLVDDRDPAVWNHLGLVALTLGDRPQALEAFRTAAALSPDYPEARANHGALLAEADDFDGAVTELEAATRQAPWSAAAWLGLGNAYRGARRFDDAEAAYRRALEVDPALADAHFNLAVLYLDGDRPDLPALARLEQALAFFDAYERQGGRDPKVPEYRKDAARAMERERKRLQREERDRLRRDAEARKREEGAAAPTPAARTPDGAAGSSAAAARRGRSGE